MKANTGLWAFGLFTFAGALSVSCGGSSKGDDDKGAAGTSSTSAGTSSKAGSAGSPGSAGTSTSSAGTGGGANNNGGRSNGGTNNFPGFGGANDFPSFGGAGGDVPSCPANTMTGGACTPGAQAGCRVNDTTYCACQNGDNPTWVCVDTDDLGGGGQGPGNFEATCPDNAMNGDSCSNGPGLCAGQECYCGFDSKVMCL